MSDTERPLVSGERRSDAAQQPTAPARRIETDDDQELRDAVQQTIEEISRVVIGQTRLVRGMLIGLLCGGHVLIEGVPGLAKTTAIATLAKTIRTSFRRLQFTPDLLPSDVIGSEIYRPQEHRFDVQPGPIFTNLLLVDEINRAPAKVQSALLEAMQERQVSIAGQTLQLPEPFMVLATQNPIDQQGTYALPEAQMDRFLMKLRVHYPPRAQEEIILSQAMRSQLDAPQPRETLVPEQIKAIEAAIERIEVSPTLLRYVLDLVEATRDPYRFGSEVGDLVQFGISPRGSIALAKVARASAFLEGRQYATPDDVKTVLADVFRHRIVLSYEALAEEKSSDEVLQMIAERVPVP